MSERVVLTQGDEGWIVESLWRGAPHNRNECPGCGQSIMRTAIVNLVYTFMECGCDQATYKHLVERLWHPDCYVESQVEGKYSQVLTGGT